MTLLQRLAACLRAFWAVARGYDVGEARPPAPPPASLRPEPAELVAEAESRGAADAASGMLDGWLFGRPDDEISDRFDPPYVNQLRCRCAAALSAGRTDRATARDRLDHIRRWRDESEREMAAARAAMGDVAVAEARLAEPDFGAASRSPDLDERFGDDPADDPDRDASDTERVWEGESRVLTPFWRTVVLAGLVAAETVVLQPVLTTLIAPEPEALFSAVGVSALMVGAPYLAALITRGRRATGAELRLPYLAVSLATAWLVPAVILGLLQGQHLSGTVRSTLTPSTGILLFVALIIIIGVMAFMIGLARQHPFQQAYVRHRLARNNLDVMYRAAADQVSDRYVDGDPTLLAEQDRTVRETFAAAEYAYFAALVRAVGDPSFTEAVQNRRGPRPPLPEQLAERIDPLKDADSAVSSDPLGPADPEPADAAPTGSR